MSSPGRRRCSSDTDLVAGDGEAGRLVSYVRADETPHVEYLRTVLSEMRDRTFVGNFRPAARRGRADRQHLGPSLAESLGPRRRRADRVHGATRWSGRLDGRPDAADVLAEFHALADPAA